MNRMLHAVTEFSSSKKGAKLVLAFWLIVALVLSFVTPGSKEVAVHSNVSDLPASVPSQLAKSVLEQHFPSKEGLPALVVFHDTKAFSQEDENKVMEISKWLAEEKPKGVASSVPLHGMPVAAWSSFFSEDQTTLLLPVSLDKGLDANQVHDTVKALAQHLTSATGNSALQVSITGPAGIASDAIGVFANADFVLMMATVVLILVLLIVLYRSPLLAIVPLVAAGVLYEVADHLLGWAGQRGLFVIESQALSIMMILLFAVLTDYSLFVFSRYREELMRVESKYEAMRLAMKQVGEPIFFSSGTILLSVLTLFVTNFKPYQHFAPVFGVALLVVLIGGLTLIPALFSVIGRPAFWPFIPKVGQVLTVEKGFWWKMGQWVTRKPKVIATVLTLVLLASSSAILSMPFTFNTLKSFPQTMGSRIGFEALEQHFAPGSLAPVTVVLESQGEVQPDARLITALHQYQTELLHFSGVQAVTPAWSATATRLPDGVLSSDGKALKFQVILSDNPYDQAALQTLDQMRGQADSMLTASGLGAKTFTMQAAGQTADMLDTRQVNQNDTSRVLLLDALVIALLLVIQSRSLLAPLHMMATILLTYGSSLGLSWLFFHKVLGYEAVSYRIPLYVFVFLVALGVDYNILLLSRIREEAAKREWSEAIRHSVAATGKTISSAGLILVATYGVLMTQPLVELFEFGFIVGLGVLIDTFLVRGLLMPSVMLLLGQWNFWPSRIKTGSVKTGEGM